MPDREQQDYVRRKKKSADAAGIAFAALVIMVIVGLILLALGLWPTG